jgi:hypothetical protein
VASFEQPASLGVHEGVVADRGQAEEPAEDLLPGGVDRYGGQPGDGQFLNQAQRLGQPTGLAEIDGAPEPEAGAGGDVDDAPPSGIRASAAWVVMNRPITLTSYMRRRSSAVTCSRGLSSKIPALFIRTSTAAP